MSAGRPLKFKTPEEIKERAEIFFKDREEKKLPFTITGLALALDTSRETLINYEKRDEFFDTIKAAKDRCEAYAEEQIFIGKNQAGSIFALKNFGWKDQQNFDHTTGGKPLIMAGEVAEKHQIGTGETNS